MLLSHPNYDYNKHIENIKNSKFNLESKEFKISSEYHDIFKLTKYNQNALSSGKKLKPHSQKGAYLYLVNELLKNKKLTKKNLIVFISIYSHHINLKDFEDYFSDDIHFNDIDEVKEVLKNSKFKVDEKLKAVLENKFNNDNDNDIRMKNNLLNFINKNITFEIKDYFLIRETFSMLILADKYEASFKESYSQKRFKYTNQLKLLDSKIENFKVKDKKTFEIRNRAINELNEVYKNISANERIFIIELPTGMGKTLLALRLALLLAKDKNLSTLIFSLPYTSIIDQAYDIYSEFFDDILKSHYLVKFDEDKKEENEKEKISYSKQEFILDSFSENSVIVTTLNKILEMFFSNKNKRLLKLHKLRDSVIIIDEIQSIPAKLQDSFSQILEVISKELNIYFILMSATIPHIKESLINHKNIFSNEYYNYKNRYKIIFDKEINNLSDLVDKIVNSKANSKIIIVNTIKKSLLLYEKLKDKSNVILILINSNFTPIDRNKKLNEIREAIKESKEIIVISTQVIEAGVDLDFDIGFREFAPISAIIQSAGRVNREGLKDICNFYVFLFDWELKGNWNLPYSYQDLMLNANEKSIDKARDKIDKIFKEGIYERGIKSLIDDYYKEVFSFTGIDLIKDIKKLNFSKIDELLADNFMDSRKKICFFIETKNGLYEFYHDKIVNLTNQMRKTKELKDKLELKSKIKSIKKEMGEYIINLDFNKTKDIELGKFFFNVEDNIESDLMVITYEEVEYRAYSYERGIYF